jgi:PBP1b-binding outer membrane lipoprotein LpoB
MKKLIAIFALTLFVTGCATHSRKVQIDPNTGGVVNATSRRQYISKPAPNVDPAIDAVLTVGEWYGTYVNFPWP